MKIVFFTILFLEIFYLIKLKRSFFEYINLIKKFFSKIKNPLVESYVEKLILKYLFKIIISFIKLIIKFLILTSIITFLISIDSDFKLIFFDIYNIIKLSIFVLIYLYLRNRII